DLRGRGGPGGAQPPAAARGRRHREVRGAALALPRGVLHHVRRAVRQGGGD
ncbi:unnamed protein product, partial [Heterosigma akashiwo]